MNPSDLKPLAELALMDPGMADAISASLEKREAPVSLSDLSMIVQDILWGLSKEINLGQAMANGYAALLAMANEKELRQYRQLVIEAAKTGPSLGKVMAVYAPSVVAVKDKKLLSAFEGVVQKMHQKGLHAIPEPLDTLTSLLDSEDILTALVYIELLYQSLAAILPFSQARHNCHHIAKALEIFHPQKQRWQLKQLLRVTTMSPVLIEPFLTGIKQGLSLLSEVNLSKFITIGLQQNQTSTARVKDFLSLKTFAAQQTLADMKIAVPLNEVRASLSRYLNARTGRRIAIEPISSIPKTIFLPNENLPMALSDGQSIFLPDSIEKFSTYEENRRLFLLLAKLESALFEFDTFEFDFEKLMSQYPDMALSPALDLSKESDLEAFFNTFSCPALAADLFTLFEHGRLWLLLSQKYPGLIRQAIPHLLEEATSVYASNAPIDIRFALYIAVTLGQNSVSKIGLSSFEETLEPLLDQYQVLFNADSSVETSGRLVFKTYPAITALITKKDPKALSPYSPLKTLFGRRIYPSLFYRAVGHLSPLVEKIKASMHSKGVAIYRSNIRRELVQGGGRFSKESMVALLKNAVWHDPPSPIADILTHLAETMPNLISNDGAAQASDADGQPVFWHAEWNHHLPDYLPRHVRVVERQLSNTPADSYHEILHAYRPLVTNIRRAFELLKPETLSLLRYWVEGDEFDYRALLDVVIDKKAGRMPSDRIYIKRIKKERDVAVLLLVDLSGSTKNRVAGTDKSVLFMEKEAIVLFCEALNVVGDAFAIAGFSGHGRLGVDYYQIKDFDDPLNEDVQNRISNMTSQRSTRIGAAIRHAVSKIEKLTAKVRLLITLGDGYPNDIDYKGAYAVADTRQAIAEARTKGIHVRPITVNLDADENIDTLYDSLHHNIISDIRELPNKLWRIYSDFTK
jgi:nitric oxide reductase NorD protein